MTTEKAFLKAIAEIILSELENNQYGLTKANICADGHFSPQMLTSERLLNMRSDTMVRLLLYISWALPPKVMHQKQFRSVIRDGYELYLVVEIPYDQQQNYLSDSQQFDLPF